MPVALSSLRVTAELDASAYAQGMKVKIDADKAAAASSGAVAAAVSKTDTALNESGGVLGRLSRAYVDGFGSAQKFQQGINALARQMELGKGTTEQHLQVLDGLYRKFGLAADATALAKKGHADLAVAVAELNTRYAAQAEGAERAAQASQRLVAQQQAQVLINDRLSKMGVGGTGDASVASQASSAREKDILSVFGPNGEYEKALQRIIAAREKEQEIVRETALLSQQMINAQLGVRGGDPRDSGSFANPEQRLADIQAAVRGYNEETRAIMATREARAQFDREQAGQYQTQLNQRLGVRSDFGGASRESDVQAAFGKGGEYDRIREKLVPLARAQREYAEAVAFAEDSQKKGIITEHEKTIEVGRANATLQQQSYAIKVAEESHAKLAKGASLTSYQMQNLGFQVNDVITGLISGQPVFQIAAQQMGQIVQILQSAGGGVRGAFQALGNYIEGWLKPIYLIPGALLAIGAAAGYAVNRYLAGQREISASLTGLGRGTSATPGSLNSLAESIADPMNVSRAAARGVVVEFASVGRIVPEVFKDLTLRGKEYAHLTGQDLPEAAKELAGAFANLGAGGEQLDKKFNIFNATTRELYQRQVAQGNATGAQTTLLAAMRPALDGAIDRTSALGRAWEYTKKQISDGADVVARATLTVLKPGETSSPRYRPNGLILGQDPNFQGEQDRVTRLSAEAAERAESGRVDEAFRQRMQDLSKGADDIAKAARPAETALKGVSDQIDFMTKAMREGSVESEKLADTLDALQRRRIQLAVLTDDLLKGGAIAADAQHAANFAASVAGAEEYDKQLAGINQKFNEMERAAGRAGQANEATLSGLQQARNTELAAFRIENLTSIIRTASPAQQALKLINAELDRLKKALAEKLELKIDTSQVSAALFAKTREAEEAAKVLAAGGTAGLASVRQTGFALKTEAYSPYGKTLAEIDRQAEESRRQAKTDREDQVFQDNQRAQRELAQREYQRQSSQVGSAVSQVPEAYRQTVLDQAARTGTDPNVLAAILKIESHFREDIISGRTVSEAGAVGIAQFMPDTAKRFGLADRTDPYESIRAQADYVKTLQDRYGQNPALIGAGYFGGEGAGDKLRDTGVMGPKTAAYVAAMSQAVPQAGALAQASRDVTLSIEEQNRAVADAEKYLGRDATAMDRAEIIRRRENEVLRQNLPLMEERKKQIAAEAAALAGPLQALRELTVARNLEFERAQIGRDSTEQTVATQLKAAGLQYETSKDGTIASTVRLNAALQQTKDISGDALKGFIGDLRAGKSAGEALTNTLTRVSDKLLDIALGKINAGFFNESGPLVGLIGKAFPGSGIGATDFSSYETPLAKGDFVVTSHTGGIVGMEHGPRRYVHPAYFDDAPRFHRGGIIGGDEVPILARRGEGVFTPGQMSAMGGGKINLNIINNGAPAKVDSMSEEPDGRGGRNFTAVMSEQLAIAATRPGPGRDAIRAPRGRVR